jgi:hypothetical protein
MGLSLNKICLLMENEALIGNKDDNLAVEAIKKGLDLRSNTKEGQTFWDDFMRVTGNARALGHLLGVDPIHIMKWRERVNKIYKQVLADRKNDELNKNKRNRMINTGDMQGDNSQGQLASGNNPQQQGFVNPSGNAGDRTGTGMG